MKLAVIGATGNVGTRILDEALNRGHEITGIARNVGPLEGRDGVVPRACDLADTDDLAEILRGHDAVIVSVRYQDNDVTKAFDACRKAGVSRVLFVGGAASLEVAPGKRLIDSPDFPEEVKVEALPAAEALDKIRREKELAWTFLSPSIMFVPGERTGKFRLGGDQLLADSEGNSSISYEDYAIALLDEVESPKHIRQRFTVGY